MMNTQQATLRFARLLLAGLAALALAGAAQADIAVIVHPSNATALDDEQISKIFLGQTKTFSGGGEAVPVDQKEGATREDFGNKVLKKNPSQLKALWARQIFTGGAKPPREMGGDDEVLKFVASTPGAIGYVDAGKANSSVKVVKR
ncbi:phosphate ABC transporter substrate-binding protein [Paucibacter sp. DJ1R-11]|uniref:phosphate ABC transporter substrate-binding protein n=1 Tax=Paucibacter sp. DJ1R-11 TaxID=2893556 RepID=UPI0021E48E88|nr:phosphate ABC transporter substrate-binding protein [Paucibacter sp. DJ1R-11]MCV2362130.1 phosphate ABC transporter substrate-binding protein [Paucibacter sp. DJ1R-11]